MVAKFLLYLKYLLPILISILSIWLKVGFGILLTLFIIISGYFAYLFFFKKTKFNPFHWIIVNICLLILIVGIPFINASEKEVESNDRVNCSLDIGKYEGKKLNILGENVKGKISIVENKSECTLTVYYLYIFSTTLPENKVGELPYLYNYSGIFGNKDLTRAQMRGTGTIFSLERNSSSYPNEIINTSEVVKFYSPFTGPSGVTPVPFFYSNFSKNYELSDVGYSQIFKDNWFGIVDLKPYMTKVEDKNMGVTYSPDVNKAELSGNIVKDFNFVISE